MLIDPRHSAAVSPALIPQGAETISSQVVDIFPLPAAREFSCTRVDLSIPWQMDQDERGLYLNALGQEREFLLTNFNRSVPEIPADATVDAVHKMFIDHGLGKVGLRNILVENEGGVVAQYCVVPHPAYRLFCESKKGPLSEFGSNLGAALMLVSSDGNLIIQHRSPANRVYGDVPGASVAGLIDAYEGMPQELDLLALARGQLLKAGNEEIGLAPAVTESFEFTALQLDKVALHHELTFTSQATLTSDEIAENALRNRQRDYGSAFRENAVIVPATTEAVELLLTEVRTPFPMTHAGPLLMLGYRLALESAPGAAAGWLSKVKAEMDENYKRIDAACADGKYTPTKSATAQGLPSFRDELDRVFGSAHRYVACAW